MTAPDATLINLAFRVADLSAVEAFVEKTRGWEKSALHEIDGEVFLEARFAGIRVNFFTSAVYDDAASSKEPGFLHASYAVPRLDEMLANEHWAGTLTWGPSEISGGFGRRRIAFFEPLPGCRIELMEELA